MKPYLVIVKVWKSSYTHSELFIVPSHWMYGLSFLCVVLL